MTEQRGSLGWAGVTIRALVVLIVLGAVVLAGAIGALDRSGPARFQIGIGYGIPATLYVPGERVDGGFPDPPDTRPPAVVVAHGFSAGQRIMSSIARSLARNGYTALTIDFRGHGTNRRGFGGDLNADLRAAVDWLEASPYADPERIFVLGHSMGAGAAVEFASIDPRPAGVIAVSGGRIVAGDHTPSNVLLLVASADPENIHRSMDGLARDLAGTDTRPGETYGDPDDGTAVRTVEIDGTDHVTILWSGRTVEETVDWVSTVSGTPAPSPVATGDPRMRAIVAYLLLALVLIGAAGRLVGRLAPVSPPTSGRAAVGGLAVLVAALAVAMPFMAFGPPAGFLPVAVGDVVVSLFLIAGLLVGGIRVLAARGIGLRTAPSWLGSTPDPGSTRALALPVAMGFAAVYVILLPLEPVFHRLVPTPGRLLVSLVASVLLLPFFIAFETLLRRGSVLTSTLWGAAGRIVVVAALVVGTNLGVLPGVLMLILPILVVLFVAFEIFAASAYAAGRNVGASAAVQSLWLGWVVGITGPFLG